MFKKLLEMAYQTDPKTHEPIKLENFSRGHALMPETTREPKQKKTISKGVQNGKFRSLKSDTNHKYIKLAKRIYMDSPTK